MKWKAKRLRASQNVVIYFYCIRRFRRSFQLFFLLFRRWFSAFYSFFVSPRSSPALSISTLKFHKKSQVFGGFNDVKLIGIKNQTDEALNEKTWKVFAQRTDERKQTVRGGKVLGQFGSNSNEKCDGDCELFAEVSRKIANFTLIVNSYWCMHWLP